LKKIQYFGWLIQVLALLILTTGMASVAAQEQGKSEPMPPAKLTTDSNTAALRYDAGATDMSNTLLSKRETSNNGIKVNCQSAFQRRVA